MTPAHALAVAKARACIANLADSTIDIDVSSRYEHALIGLDELYPDNVPGLGRGIPNCTRHDPYGRACAAVEELLDHGAEPLRVELILARLDAAHDLERVP